MTSKGQEFCHKKCQKNLRKKRKKWLTVNAVWSSNGEESWYFKLVIKSWQSHLATSFKRTAKHQIGRCCTAFVGRLVGTWCSVLSIFTTYLAQIVNHQMRDFCDIDNSWDKVFADRFFWNQRIALMLEAVAEGLCWQSYHRINLVTLYSSHLP